VGIGRIPSPIDDAEIANIQTTIRSGLLAEPWPFLNVGQRVRVEEGPLSGVEGILIDARKKQRIVVSVSLLTRSVAVEIEREWVRPVGSILTSEMARSAQMGLSRSAASQMVFAGDAA
jgi:transcription antitermination factor NusG